eukprot:960053-Pelagomonas_calceolata.AAC.2
MPCATRSPRPPPPDGTANSKCSPRGSPENGLSPGAGFTSCSDRAAGRDSTNRSSKFTQAAGGACEAGVGVGDDARVLRPQVLWTMSSAALPLSCNA